MAFIRVLGDQWIKSDMLRIIYIDDLSSFEIKFRVLVEDNTETKYVVEEFKTIDEALECVESIINRCI